MAQNRGVIYGPKADRQIQKTVREVARRMRNETPDRGRYNQRTENRQAILQHDLYAAVDTLTDPSEAVAELLVRNGANLELSGETVTVVNRFENISIDKGSYIKIEWIDGEWQPYAADCGIQSESWSFMASSNSITPSPSVGGI